MRLRLVVGCYLHSSECWEKISDREWLVAGWTQPAWADAAAEEPALRAILITEIAGLAGWAGIDGAWPRRTRWNRWKRSRMSAPPRGLTTRIIAEALSTHTLEASPAHRADR